MEATSYLHLHQEHRNWLSQIDFWKGEVAFLKGLCQKLPAGHPANYELNRSLDHLSKWLENMKLQIDSHENFLRESWWDFPESLEMSNLEDHHQNRHHMKHFKEAIRHIKGKIYYYIGDSTPKART